jgi:hypothetical protein
MMAVRKCPHCLAVIPAPQVVAYTDGIDCPGCKARLEVAAASRFLATATGLLAAIVVWRLSPHAAGTYGWVLPMVYAIFAFSLVAPLMLMAFADLRNRPAEPGAEPVSHAAASGPGGHH